MKKFFSAHKTAFILFTLTIIGAVLRLAVCFWGYPHQLHPDEWIICDYAIDLIKRHSYEVSICIWPAHFNIKGTALLFQLVAKLLYKTSAELIYEDKKMIFYLVARGFTTLFGVGMIPLSYAISEKMKKNSGLITALLFTFFPIFIKHSGYATTDIVLAFFVLLITYLSIKYIEKPSLLNLGLLCLAAGTVVTVKYTSAICCVWIAAIVIRQCILDKKYWKIVTLGIFCMVIVFGTAFALAPNIFTDWQNTLDTVAIEARTEHPGADGLNFFGNCWFYFKTFFNAFGYEGILLMIVGLFFGIKGKQLNQLALGLGVFFYLFVGNLALHWERWGIPMYLFFMLLIGLGISWLWEYGKENKIVKLVGVILSVIVMVNVVTSGLLTVQSIAFTQEARIDAIDYCNYIGITEENTIYDGYGPFQLDQYGTFDVELNGKDKIIYPIEKRYLVISSGCYDRYLNEPERHGYWCNIYNQVRTDNNLIYKKGGDYFTHSNFATLNIFNSISGLLTHNDLTRNGYVVEIYEVVRQIR